MIISCPSCATRFHVPAESIGVQGRKVRCARCRHVWHVAPDGSALVFTDKEPKESAVQLPDTEEGKNAGFFGRNRLQRRHAVRIFSAWSVLALVLTAIVGGGYIWRDTIVGVWPQSATLYAALGVDVNPLGMTFRNVTYDHSYENGLPVLSIRGEIVNVSSRRVTVPHIQVQLKDARNQELYHWTFALDRPLLPPKGKAQFVTRLSSPPADARHLEVRFALHEQS